MTSNKLKIIACISMVLDHIGYLLFPNIIHFRYLGRIALPLFAFFVAEGCIYTRSKIKYFLQMLILGVACQLFYVGEAIASGQITEIYLNILFTFCLSVLVCSAFIYLKKAVQNKNKKQIALCGLLFALSIIFAAVCCAALTSIFGITITVDYGIEGVLLPLFAVMFKNKNKRLIAFSVGTVIYCLVRFSFQPYIWFSLLALPLLLVYNGKRGNKKLKWAFYLFYPLHFAAIYGISMLV